MIAKPNTTLRCPRQSKLFSFLSWLPALGGSAFVAFYFLTYKNAGFDPNTGNIIQAVSAGYNGIYSLANYILLMLPVIALFWIVSLVLARTRSLRLGWINIFAFSAGCIMYVVVSMAVPDYLAWFAY